MLLLFSPRDVKLKEIGNEELQVTGFVTRTSKDATGRRSTRAAKEKEDLIVVVDGYLFEPFGPQNWDEPYESCVEGSSGDNSAI